MNVGHLVALKQQTENIAVLRDLAINNEEGSWSVLADALEDAGRNDAADGVRRLADEGQYWKTEFLRNDPDFFVISSPLMDLFLGDTGATLVNVEATPQGPRVTVKGHSAGDDYKMAVTAVMRVTVLADGRFDVQTQVNDQERYSEDVGWNDDCSDDSRAVVSEVAAVAIIFAKCNVHAEEVAEDYLYDDEDDED